MNFVFAPAPSITSAKFIDFQANLAKPERGLGFEQAALRPDSTGLTLSRSKSPLQTTVQIVGQGVAQLLVVAPQPAQPLDDFIGEAECVCDAFVETWPADLTIIARDVALRRLYPLGQEHAFKYLWESRLHQSDSLSKVFKRGILGGGIRLVFPPRPEIDNDPLVEIKIESFLQDPSKLFVETTAMWQVPVQGASPQPRDILKTAEEMANGPVEEFILMEE